MENGDLTGFLKDWFESSDLNRLPIDYDGGRFFADPLIGVARGNDKIFIKFKEVVDLEHLTPLELWLKCGEQEVPPSTLRVVSIVFPYVDKIRKESESPIVLPHIKIPSEYYSVARNYANEFKKETLRRTINYFKGAGYKAVGAMVSDIFTIISQGGFCSNWSERHIAFAAGLGTFSLHEGFITEIGCNVRFASFVTNVPFEVTKRISEEPYSNCLYYTNNTCRKCEEQCPAGAITKDGHDKMKCWAYGRNIEKEMRARIGTILKPHIRRVNGELRDPSFPVGCAFCQFGVPCMDKNPTTEFKTTSR